jgi:hypothetical protein
MSNIYVPEGAYDRIVIMAPGPSLTKDDVDYVMSKGVFTIVIGDVGYVNPFADILYHCDAKWWTHHKGMPDFLGCQRLSIEPVPQHAEVKQLILSKERLGLSTETSTVVGGSNSGYQAINLALHYKPKQLFLLGYDMKKAKDGRYNINGDHHPDIKGRSNFPVYIRKISTLAPILANHGITVYNCSTDSNLNCF